MSEFRIHHHVNELIELLGIKTNASPEKYVEFLTRDVTPYTVTQISSHNAVTQLAHKSPNPEAFLQKYEELKERNIHGLDPLMSLLARVSEDKKLKKLLEGSSVLQSEVKAMSVSPTSEGSEELPASASRLTSEELSQLRDRLLREASVTHGPSEVISCIQRDGQGRPQPLNHTVPAVPCWFQERKYLTFDFVTGSSSGSMPGPLGAVPTSSQETALLDDLLFCLAGIEGHYIVSSTLEDRHAIRTFRIDESVEPSLRELVKRILPLCSHYSTTVRFMEEKAEFVYGQVNQALAAAMRNLLKDYMVMVGQLETQHRRGVLTLHKLWFYIQPTMRTMDILASVATAINKAEATGGEVLSLLHEKTINLTGDCKAQELCLYITQAACVPYMEILEKWVYKGLICDPYGEFLVEDNEVIQKEELPMEYSDDYWEKRYTIRRERTPVFLEKVADLILRTGKYLNVIRQCDQTVKSPQAEEIVYTIKERQYVEAVEKAYTFASKTLLLMLLDDKDLMGRLRSVKHYFLLDQGDFIVQFLDLCEAELQKNIDDIVPTRLESLLELALRTSAANSDQYKDDVRVELLPYDLMFQMFKILSIETQEEKEYRTPVENLHLSGLEAFTFGYEVKWPVSLVLNRKALACYQMIFRHLFYCKHVERLLCSVWIANKVAKSFPLTASRTYGSAFAMRQRMLNFVQNLEYYMMFEVLEPNWQHFLIKLQKVSNVDEVLVCHMDFLNTCLKDCMLTSPELLRTVNKLMSICVTFCNFIQHMKRYFVDAELCSMIDVGGQSLEERESPEPDGELSESESFEQTIAKFDLQFTGMLVSLLDRVSDLGRENYNEKLVNILYRLDFNGYYTEQLEKLCAEKSLLDPGRAEKGISG